MNGFVVNLYNDMMLSIKQGNAVNGKSIAKPILLLSIIECIASADIECNQILWTNAHLKDYYERLMRKYNGQSKLSLVIPYYHLASAPFYHLVWKSENRPQIKGHSPSSKYLRENLLYAKLDDELWELLQDEESREYLRESIVRRYLGEPTPPTKEG